MADVIRAYLKQQKYMIIDGALGTELERRGAILMIRFGRLAFCVIILR